jgi:hypothetical protein
MYDFRCTVTYGVKVTKDIFHLSNTIGIKQRKVIYASDTDFTWRRDRNAVF